MQRSWNPTARICAALVVSLLAANAGADPRWWQNERSLSGTVPATASADVAVIPVNALGSGIPIVIVAYEAGTTDIDIEVTASFNAGCTWCTRRFPWANAVGNETRPRIAAGVTATGMVSIQVVYELGGEVWVASDVLIDLASSPSDQCLDLSLPAPPTPIRLSRAGVGDARPRIAVARDATILDFFAVWHRLGAVPSIEFARDLVGDGSGWATAIDLSAVIGSPGLNPDVAADLVATVGSAVSVTFQNQADGRIRLARSSDSSATWGAIVDVSGAPGRTLPAIDSSTNPATGDATVWNGIVWQGTTSPPDITFDGAHWSAPASRNPDFNPTPADHPVSTPPPIPGTGAAVALAPASPGALPRIPMYAFWTDLLVMSELAARPGLLDAFNLTMPRDLDAFPFPPQRVAPPDPGVTGSLATPFTNCTFDSFTGECLPNGRAAGVGAARAAAAATGGTLGLPATFVTVFTDDRSGLPRIYFKMTDGMVAPPALVSLTSACPTPPTAEATVLFDLLAACPAVPERILRYFIYYGGEVSDGAGPDGPFLRRIAIPNVGLPNPMSLSIPGLNPGERYHFVVVPEDEARNLYPAGFDETNSGNLNLPVQSGTVVAATCGAQPNVVVDACPFLDDCVGVGGNGVDPGDIVTYTITFRNLGATAVDFTADVAVAGGTLLTGTTIAPPVSIPAGGTHDHQFSVRVTAACGGRLDVSVVNLAWSGGGSPDDLVSCDATVDPTGPTCVACCTATVPTGVVGNFVRAVANDSDSDTERDDVDLTWVGATVLPPDYVIYRTSDKTKLAESATVIGTETLRGGTTSTAWTEFDAVTPPPTLLMWKVLPGDSCGGAIFPCDIGPCLR